MAHLLVVDDVELGRIWLRGVLESNGHTVVDASNGKDAITCVEKSRFDLVITDIVMPGMDGVELIRQLRGSGRQTLKVLAISAGAGALPSDLGLQMGSAVGADAILYMPCEAQELISAVDRLLGS
jgi:CheY-like chemotaxis protein